MVANIHVKLWNAISCNNTVKSILHDLITIKIQNNKCYFIDHDALKQHLFYHTRTFKYHNRHLQRDANANEGKTREEVEHNRDKWAGTSIDVNSTLGFSLHTSDNRLICEGKGALLVPGIKVTMLILLWQLNGCTNIDLDGDAHIDGRHNEDLVSWCVLDGATRIDIGWGTR